MIKYTTTESTDIQKTSLNPQPTLKTPKSFQETISSYWQLTKPKVVALLLITAIVGMCLATDDSVPFSTLFFGLIGMGFAMGGSAAVNQVVDHHIDAKMRRTQNRPLVLGQITPNQALIFALSLIFCGVLILEVWVNRLTAVLTLLGAVGYAVIYTLFLKRATPQNIVVGGLAGAIPPLLGWTATSGEFHGNALLPVLIIFTWTPPHFWALAIHRADEYREAKIPMLPVTHGIEFTKTLIIFYTVLLLLVSWLPYITRMSGWLYAVTATVLGCVFLGYALKLKFNPTTQTAMRTFGYSIVYLFALFIGLLFDHYLIDSTSFLITNGV
ncbi:MAG: heme o synthase [Bdellovibrionota bacterium]